MSFFSSKWNTVKPKPGVMIDPSHPLSKGLVGFWLFSEGTGSQCYDISGNGNHGTLNNMSVNSEDSGWCGSKFGDGLQFDGTDDYVDCGTTANCDGQGTLAIWIKGNSWPSNCGVVAKGNSGGDYYISYGVWQYSTGRPQVFIADGSSAQTVEYATTLSTGVWYHLVYTWDGSHIKIYLNGTLDKDPVAQTVQQAPNSRKLLFGAGETGAYFFDGLIDFVMLYNRALSAEEIKTLYYDPFCNLLRIPIRYVPTVPEAGQPMMKHWGGIPFMKGQRFGAKVW